MEKYISEDYCSKEITGLLQDKGYVGSTNTYLDKDGFRVKEITLQSAMKWLREVHSIAIETEWEHLWYVYIKPMTSKPSEEDYYQCESSKYEEACEAAIKYCLENLV